MMADYEALYEEKCGEVEELVGLWGLRNEHFLDEVVGEDHHLGGLAVSQLQCAEFVLHCPLLDALGGLVLEDAQTLLPRLVRL